MPEETETVVEPIEEVTTSYTPPSEESARWFFDYKQLYWEIRAKLYGGWLEEDKKGNYVIKKPKYASYFMNTQGIEGTMSVINAFVTKIQALTIFDEERIMELCRDLHITLAKHYYINMEKYDLDPIKATIVIRMIMNLFESNLRKSLGGKSMMLIGETERIVEQRVEPRKKLFGVI